MQGHKVHVVGMGEVWGRELPGIAEGRDRDKKREESKERMKIAWRYEGLGAHGSTRERGASCTILELELSPSAFEGREHLLSDTNRCSILKFW